MLTRVIVALFALVVAFAILGADLKRVPIRTTSAAAGLDMYTQYCAVCHGRDARGTGPAVSALKDSMPDLTTLAARNNGKFPELRVFGAIAGDTEMAAHGSKDMPVWGTVFHSMSRDSGAETQMRLANLTNYIKSLQR